MGYTVGEVARVAGVTVRTLHHYEQIGLLSPAGRSPSGYRVYTEHAVARIRLARHLQGLGMTLDEIADTVHAHDAGGSCSSECQRLEAVRDRVAAEQARLAEMRAELETPQITIQGLQVRSPALSRC